MEERQAHPARTVVLLPYAQLMPEAARRWAQWRGRGFAPRFETTQNWCQTLGGWTPQGGDYTGDPAWDSLTARALLEQAGAREAGPAAVSRLVEAARELAPRMAAQVPGTRADWAQAQGAELLRGLDSEVLHHEAQWAQVALVWLGHSAFYSDRLWDPVLIAAIECLVVVPGFQPDPLLEGLLQAWGPRACRLEPWAGPPHPDATPQDFAGVAWHPAGDPQDEVQRAAACVLRHLEAGRAPVAVPVIDRALTRQIRALLEGRGVQIRDETGWKLSTTRAAAQVMLALRACAWDASTDGVLDWLQHGPACEPGARRLLESWARERGARRWSTLAATSLPPGAKQASIRAAIETADGWRQVLAGRHTLTQWWGKLRELLQVSGQWDALLGDAAGQQVVQALRLNESDASACPPEAVWAGQRLTLEEFTAWVDRVLEGASFKAAYPRHEQVIFLPLAQAYARDFGAVVVAGCDEVRLPASAEPSGLWTRAQRAQLGLTDRESIARARRKAFLDALGRPAVDVLWRQADGGGESLLPAPWVRWARWVTEGARDQCAADPRVLRPLAVGQTSRPGPRADSLAYTRVSASAYQDLRACPYRFFALRLLGLRERPEIDTDLDKSDVGLWLHEVLQNFHETDPGADRPGRVQALDAAAADTMARRGLEPADMVPYQASWPALREGYLDWLDGHEAQGWRFERGEVDALQPLAAPAGVMLQGRLDRIDQGPGRLHMIIDYKTEALATTRARLRTPLEDTQLAFYAALLPEPGVRAAYVNVAERDGTSAHEPEDLEALRTALLAGLESDLSRVAGGAPLPALGEGRSCEHCAARGLCRRDFWSADA